MTLLDSNPAVGKTAGAFFLGVILATALWGAGCVQLYHYFSRYNDDWAIKNLVIVVAVLVTAHQGLIINTSYTYLVTEFGNFAYLSAIVKGHNASMLLCGFVCCMVQCFMLHRVWKLSHGNIPVVFGLGTLVLAQISLVLAYFALAAPFNRFPDLSKYEWLSRTTNIVEATCDMSIALVLIYLLWRSRTGFHRSETLIKRLIILTISTGLATSLCALMTLIMSLVYPDTTTYLAFFICNSPLYMSALLATLNLRTSSSRSRSGSRSNPGSSMLSPLRSHSRPEKSFGEAATSHIKISVVTETHSDQLSSANKRPVPETDCETYLPYEPRIIHPYNAETSVCFQED